MTTLLLLFVKVYIHSRGANVYHSKKRRRYVNISQQRYLTACFIIDCRSASKFSDRLVPLGCYVGLWINNSKFSD